MKQFIKEVFQSLRSTLKWLLIVGIVAGVGIFVADFAYQWEVYQAAAHQVALQQAAKVKGGAQ